MAKPLKITQITHTTYMSANNFNEGVNIGRFYVLYQIAFSSKWVICDK